MYSTASGRKPVMGTDERDGKLAEQTKIDDRERLGEDHQITSMLIKNTSHSSPWFLYSNFKLRCDIFLLDVLWISQTNRIWEPVWGERMTIYKMYKNGFLPASSCRRSCSRQSFLWSTCRSGWGSSSSGCPSSPGRWGQRRSRAAWRARRWRSRSLSASETRRCHDGFMTMWSSTH